jgi:hypothetical protein
MEKEKDPPLPAERGSLEEVSRRLSVVDAGHDVPLKLP